MATSERRKLPKEMQRTRDERVTERSATLVCFSVRGEKFDSASERNKFFRGLYGWKQTVKTEDAGGHEKEYTYERHGVLDRVPHKRVDQSSIIMDDEKADDVLQFFKSWTNKVMWRTFRVMLGEEDELESDETGEEEIPE
ncbi:MAG: hypothetical protein NT016_00635 [Candidatus Aenigmarchaeota archaeon]|nr:hypothetical protein [Candidatus Aenigmarchaeota archaeon]